MKLVLLESPYAASTPPGIERHVAYARLCLLDCLQKGEAPMASHLLYTQVLDDLDPQQRELGILAGLAWGRACGLAVFYMDFGMSNGMKAAEQTHKDNGTQCEYRVLDENILEALHDAFPDISGH